MILDGVLIKKQKSQGEFYEEAYLMKATEFCRYDRNLWCNLPISRAIPSLD